MQLGFGIMRFGNYTESIDYCEVQNAISEYMKGEICYFDLHPAYVMGKSQSIFRDYVVRQFSREKYIVADKMPYYGISEYLDYENIFDSELDECGITYFDYYMLHAVTEDVHKMHENIGGYHFISNLKNSGKAKNIGISFHGSPELLEEILAKYRELDFVQLQINFLDWEDPIVQAKKNYEIARKYKKRILVMEPLKGGTLLCDEQGSGIIRSCFQFLSNLDGIDIVLSGMTTKKQVEENREIIEELNGNKEGRNKQDLAGYYQELRQKFRERINISCTGCRYCVSECPKNIPVPDVLRLLNTYSAMNREGKGFLGGSKSYYRSIVYKKGKAGECIFCGRCEKRCPQKLEIRKYMRQAKKMFEENHYYSAERNVQILVYLLKEHGIKKIVVSPGTTNICLVQSLQCDPWFEIYSSADERSAAYMAVGLARESGEPVVLSCTGATASRNYIPALTEAFYSKIPIIAVTSSQPIGRIGHNVPQMIDRRVIQNDIAYLSVELPLVKDDEDEWVCAVNANKAILTTLDNRKGPAHINLVTSYNSDFSVRSIPPAQMIRKHRKMDGERYDIEGKVAIFVGAHNPWNEKLTEKVDLFCRRYNAVVISDHTGNYRGEYGIANSLIFKQEIRSEIAEPDLLIHVGNISGAGYPLLPKKVWRVNPDGEIVDTFRRLTDVFEMEEEDFFEYFTKDQTNHKEIISDHLIYKYRLEEKHLRDAITELPFSNIWGAREMVGRLPANSVIHFGILNSLRAFNFFGLKDGVDGFANTGGFGIDGCVSSLIGASLSNPEKLYYGIVGDLAFFYDMNVLGNRHIGANVRLLVVNNGCGTEFMNYNHAASVLSESERQVIAASGHYGNRSETLLKSYAESLGFRYLSASNKEEYERVADEFLCPDIGERSIVFEMFTDPEDESEALRKINTLGGSHGNSKIVRKSNIPDRFRNIKNTSLILWGTGKCYSENIVRIKQRVTPHMVVDNDEKKWGSEFDGIICKSPKEIKKIENPFVVVMLKDLKMAMQVVNQLLDMGVTQFDIFANWVDYVDEVGFYDK